MTRYLVVSRSDGRGGIQPFGTGALRWKAGTKVQIGHRTYKVTSDGRVNIPKSVFDDFGRKYKDRKVIEIEFTSKKGPSGKFGGATARLAAIVQKPRILPHRKLRTGMKAHKLSRKMTAMKRVALEPMDVDEYNWSPE